MSDHVVVTVFPSPASYTGEDVAEVSAHGSPVVLAAIIRRAVMLGARLAEPGEFTLRAFLHGKVDLVQAEAVADLIDAVTPLQARAAFDQLEGTLTRRIAAIERTLFDLVARLEASLDFPEEGYHFTEPGEAADQLAMLIGQLDALLAQSSQGRLLREGAHVAIVGRPNVGKSSLFNALVNANRAIVTEVPGTTRDLLAERANIGGLSLALVDTAGLRETVDVVEREGVERARGAQRVADLVMVVLDRSRPLDEDDRALLSETAGRRRIVIANKCDLPPAWADAPGVRPIEVSVRTGAGMARLLEEIPATLAAGAPLRDQPDITNLRHVALIEQARRSLSLAAEALSGAASEEFPLADLQDALQSLQEVTGRRTTEDLLRHIFERFCIGK